MPNRKRANLTQEEFIRGNIYENPEWGNVDWRTTYMRQIEKIRRIKAKIRLIITDPKFDYLEIPSRAVSSGNQKLILYDIIFYRNERFLWFPGSPYAETLSLNPTEDEVVDYVTERILNGTYKLTPDNYLNDNAIKYVINDVRKRMR